MYLNLLTDDQKYLFLDLALITANADSKEDDEELSVISEYCNEMNISFDRTESSMPLNQLLERITLVTDMTQRKIIVFELTGLAMADSSFCDNEKKIIKLASIYFQLDDSFTEQCETLIKVYLNIQDRLNNLIINPENQ